MKKRDWNKYDKKYKIITIKYTHEDYNEIKLKAETFGIRTATYIRNVSISKKMNPIKTNLDKEFITQIRLIGNNINQLTRNINSLCNRNRSEEALAFRSDLEKITQTLFNLREKYDS